MKKLLLLLILSLGLIGTTSAGEVNAMKLKALGSCIGCDLSNANYSGADLSGVDLWRANVSGANFRGADLSGVDLWNADLRGANFSGADLSYADLRLTNLRNTNLSGANLTGANLYGAFFCITETPWGRDNTDCGRMEYWRYQE